MNSLTEQLERRNKEFVFDLQTYQMENACNNTLISILKVINVCCYNFIIVILLLLYDEQILLECK